MYYFSKALSMSNYIYLLVVSGKERVSRPNPLIPRRYGVGRRRAAEGLPPADRAARELRRTPHPTHFYDEIFYRACRRFSFSIFYVYFPKIINYVWNKGSLGLLRRQEPRRRVFCFRFFFMVSSMLT